MLHDKRCAGRIDESDHIAVPAGAEWNARHDALMGVLAGAPLLFMWLYGTNRIKFMRYGDVPSIASAKQVKKETKEFDDYMDKVREREHKRKEKDKLREMLESSLQDEDDKEEES